MACAPNTPINLALTSDYPELQRSELPDYLCKPNFGALLPHFKVEIGGEVNSTCGSEPSYQRTRDDLNFHRGCARESEVRGLR